MRCQDPECEASARARAAYLASRPQARGLEEKPTAAMIALLKAIQHRELSTYEAEWMIAQINYQRADRVWYAMNTDAPWCVKKQG